MQRGVRPVGMFITRWRVAFEDSTVPLDGRAARVAFVLDLEPRVVRACTIGHRHASPRCLRDRRRRSPGRAPRRASRRARSLGRRGSGRFPPVALAAALTAVAPQILADEFEQIKDDEYRRPLHRGFDDHPRSLQQIAPRSSSKSEWPSALGTTSSASSTAFGKRDRTQPI
jgi:hypothetical protein